MSVAIVGWSGLVGQNLLTQLPQRDIDLYNSRNIESLRGKTYDTLYFCAMPAEKWKINKNPEADYSTLIALQGILKTVIVSTFILISTVDVMDSSVEQTESGTIYADHPYGKHRRWLEDFVRENFSNSYVIRLPGLFGWGLKKNIIYDLLNNNQVSNVCLTSKFQWYFLDNLVRDISDCISRGIHTIQLVSEPISVNTVVSRFFPEKVADCTGTAVVEYKLLTEHGRDDTLYWIREGHILEEMGKFIEREKKLIYGLPYRLSVSNIAWDDVDNSDIIKILRGFHIDSVEMAPTKICGWNDWTSEAICAIKARDYPYTSCQSILYGTDIKIFEKPAEFINHYEKVCYICSQFGIKYIVFGSPQARHLTDGCDPIGLFRIIGDISLKYDVICCIEPNSSKYGCTWLTTLSDVYAFVKTVGHDNVRINFDFGNYFMEDDKSDIVEAMSYIAHIQISMPYLEYLSNITEDIHEPYSAILRILNEQLYSNNISLEMKTATLTDICKSIYKYVSLMILA
jgi:sugar phosphate isomerase/epimerase